MVNERLLQLYIESKRENVRSEKTLLRYQFCIENFLQSENVKTEDVTIDNIRSFLQKKCDSDAKDSTIATFIEIFKSYFGWLKRNNFISVNPMDYGNIQIERTVQIIAPF